MIIQQKNVCIGQKIKPWIHAISPDPTEVDLLCAQYLLEKDHILDAMDPNELARQELFPDGKMIIMRMAICPDSNPESYQTLPLACFFTKQAFITISYHSATHLILGSHYSHNEQNLDVASELTLILHILLRANGDYLRALKELQRHTDSIEKHMPNVHNKEITQLFNVSKVLQSFMPSLRGNAILLEKLKRSRYWTVGEMEFELFEDTEIETRQALEATQIYQKNVEQMMQAFSTLSNNNLNIIMKRLTLTSLMMMFPTVIASFMGMNVIIPMAQQPHAFVGIVTASIMACVGIFILLRKTKFF